MIGVKLKYLSDSMLNFHKFVFVLLIQNIDLFQSSNILLSDVVLYLNAGNISRFLKSIWFTDLMDFKLR